MKNSKKWQYTMHRTILLWLRLEKTLRGHLRCRWPEHQLRMLSHSTVLEGPGPSSLCRRTSCFSARTAVFSSICSNWRGRREGGLCKVCLSPECLSPFPLLDTHIPLPERVPGRPSRQWGCSQLAGCSAESTGSCCCQSGRGRSGWCPPAGPASRRDGTHGYWWTQEERRDGFKEQGLTRYLTDTYSDCGECKVTGSQNK